MKRLSLKHLALFGCVATTVGMASIFALLTAPSHPTYAETPAATPPVAVPAITAPQTPVTTNVNGHPNRIIAPTVGVDLPVQDGIYNSKTHQWTLGPSSAYFATPSQLPNNTSGTTYIYGHDTQAVFHSLHKLQSGAEVVVVTNNGYRFIYTFKNSVITTPYDTNEVTASSATPRLSLQTCYGPTSAERRIFHFDFSRVEKL